jgi:hypothetical protein
MNASRRASTRVKPSGLISGFCHHLTIRACTPSVPLCVRWCSHMQG